MHSRIKLLFLASAFFLAASAGSALASVGGGMPLPVNPMSKSRSVDVPAKAMSPDHVIYFYIDMDKLQAKSISETVNTLLAKATPTIRMMAQGGLNQELPKMKQGLLAMRNAGARAIVFSPGMNQPTTSLVQGDHSTTARKIATAISATMDPHSQSPTVKPFTGNWYLVTEKGLPAPNFKTDKFMAERLDKLLGAESDAPIRVAFVMTPAAKKFLQQDPPPAGPTRQFVNIIQKIDTLDVGVTLGNDPQVVVHGHFKTVALAKIAHRSVLSLLARSRKEVEDQLQKAKIKTPSHLLDTIFDHTKPAIDGQIVTVTLDKTVLQGYVQMMGLQWQAAMAGAQVQVQAGNQGQNAPPPPANQNAAPRKAPPPQW